MNILLTSVGRRSYMVKYFQAALLGSGKVLTANSDFTYAMQISDGWTVSPLIYDSRYINFILDFCKQNDISAVISLFDVDLPVLAKNRQRFSRHGIQLIVSSTEVAELCNDKWKTYIFLKENNFLVPETYISVNKALDAIKSKRISFPLMVKPRWGMGSIEINQAESEESLVQLYSKVKTALFSTYLKFESKVDPDNSVVIQEKLGGQEYGLDILNDLKANYLACVPKKKLAMRAGETDSAETINDESAIALGKKISQKLGHIGNLDVDCFKVGNKYYILEMNCRFGGQYPFAHLAGVDFPKALVSMLERSTVNPSDLQFDPGVRGTKELHPVVLDLEKAKSD